MITKTVGHLTITTPSDREIVMTRVFDAPRALVWEAHTKPELVKRWLGVFGDMELEVCEMDLRPGGKGRYVWRNRKTGERMGMSMVFREVVAPERLVNTEEFDDAWYEGTAVGTLTLVETGGRTTLTSAVLYDTKEIRDAVLASPMETGVAASYDGLADLLARGRTAA
jgi:uncharacterized protein YndB with AHSA1/START domain